LLGYPGGKSVLGVYNAVQQDNYGLAAWRAGFGITTLGLGAYGLLSSKACFAAGTPLLTPHGAKSVETFQVGDLLLSRADDNPKGDVEAKCVEEVFVRSALIWHVHVGGQVIRSTAEHPFYVEGEGWVACQDLKIGDRLLAADGTTVAVEDLLDTSEYETVYNLSIADFHTYFVGCHEWGFSVWAHNAPCATIEEFMSKYPALTKGLAGEKASKVWEAYLLGARGRKDVLIGKYPDLKPSLRNPTGLNLLDLSRTDPVIGAWTLRKNQAWLQGAIDGRKPIKFLSDPNNPLNLTGAFLEEVGMVNAAEYSVPSTWSGSFAWAYPRGWRGARR
jgi:hypothetical protein